MEGVTKDIPSNCEIEVSAAINDVWDILGLLWPYSLFAYHDQHDKCLDSAHNLSYSISNKPLDDWGVASFFQALDVLVSEGKPDGNSSQHKIGYEGTHSAAPCFVYLLMGIESLRVCQRFIVSLRISEGLKGPSPSERLNLLSERWWWVFRTVKY